MNDKELHQHCINWVEWCRTRGYYLAPGAKNILARMQPHRPGTPPNARNDPDMQFFNMAVHTLADMKEYAKEFACFSFCYVERRRGVKREAARLDICRKTYYNHINAFARKAVSMSLSLKSAHAAMMAQDALVANSEID